MYLVDAARPEARVSIERDRDKNIKADKMNTAKIKKGINETKLLALGNSIQFHEVGLYLQPTIPPKYFDIFPPEGALIRRSRCVQSFFRRRFHRGVFAVGDPDLRVNHVFLAFAVFAKSVAPMKSSIKKQPPNLAGR